MSKKGYIAILTGNRIYGSASIGDDETIYIGTHNRCLSTNSKLYAIYPNGSEMWHWKR